MRSGHRAAGVLLATAVASLAPALPAAAQDTLLRDPPVLEEPPRAPASGGPGRSSGRDAGDPGDARDARPAVLAETGADLRGLTLLGGALVLAGAGLRLRTSRVRW